MYAVRCLWGKGTLRLLRAGSCRISPSCYESLCVYVEGTRRAVILLSLSLPTQESKIQFLENISKHNRCRHARKCQKALGVSASSRWSLAQISTVLMDELGKGSTLSPPFPPSYSPSFLRANCCVSHQIDAGASPTLACVPLILYPTMPLLYISDSLPRPASAPFKPYFLRSVLSFLSLLGSSLFLAKSPSFGVLSTCSLHVWRWARL